LRGYGGTDARIMPFPWSSTYCTY